MVLSVTLEISDELWVELTDVVELSELVLLLAGYVWLTEVVDSTAVVLLSVVWLTVVSEVKYPVVVGAVSEEDERVDVTEETEERVVELDSEAEDEVIELEADSEAEKVVVELEADSEVVVLDDSVLYC